MREVWYRAWARVRTHDADFNSDGDLRGVHELNTPEVFIHFDQFPVIRHTPKGVWLDARSFDGRERFVLKEANKRFACPTKEEAFVSLKMRTNHRVGHLGRQLRRAQILKAYLADENRAEEIPGPVHVVSVDQGINR